MSKWYEDTGFQGDVVLSTRIRLARNIKGFPFPAKMNDEQCSEVINLIEEALNAINYKFRKIVVNTLPVTEREKLVEGRYISPDLAKKSQPCAVFISEDESVSIMVNEEDHLRMQSIFAGLECRKAYDIISKIDTYLAEKLTYSVHPKYGHLTSCLTNVGTGMRVSFMMHLPALCMSSAAESMFAALGKIGITVRGMYGEGTKSSGYLFQISNQMTLGPDENEIIDRLSDAANQVISKERELRTSLLKSRGAVLEDKLMRSYGIVREARLLSGDEMMSLFSDIRFAVSVGLIADIDTRTLNSLMVETSPAHLAVVGESAAKRDFQRAKIVRSRLGG